MANEQHEFVAQSPLIHESGTLPAPRRDPGLGGSVRCPYANRRAHRTIVVSQRRLLPKRDRSTEALAKAWSGFRFGRDWF